MSSTNIRPTFDAKKQAKHIRPMCNAKNIRLKNIRPNIDAKNARKISVHKINNTNRKISMTK